MIDGKKILKEAKEIMDKFSGALEKVGEKDLEIGQEAEPFLRDGIAIKKDTDFVDGMLENAPKKKDQFIVAEKKNW